MLKEDSAEEALNDLHIENKALKEELKSLKEEYKELFAESEAVAQAHGGLILLVEGFVDKAQEMY